MNGSYIFWGFVCYSDWTIHMWRLFKTVTFFLNRIIRKKKTSLPKDYVISLGMFFPFPCKNKKILKINYLFSFPVLEKVNAINCSPLPSYPMGTRNSAHQTLSWRAMIFVSLGNSLRSDRQWPIILLIMYFSSICGLQNTQHFNHGLLSVCGIALCYRKQNILYFLFSQIKK